MNMRYGYKASAEQFGPRELIDYSRLAEDLGLETIAVSDHFQPWRHKGGHTPAVFPWLGAIGENTTKALLGTSVLTPTMRYHPSIVAQAFATLACLNPGRVFLGVGTGEALNETPATGAEWPGAKPRRMMMREAIELIRQLWSEERVTFEGEYYKTDRATIYDRPDEPIPIYVAASGPLAAKLAGRVGDGYIATSGKDPQLYLDLLATLTEGAEAAGRNVDDIDKFIEIKVSYDKDVDYAKEACHFWAPLALKPEEKTGHRRRDRDGGGGRQDPRPRPHPVHRLRRPRRGRREDRPLRRGRLQPPRHARARPRPGTLPAGVLQRRAPAPPRPLRGSGTRVTDAPPARRVTFSRNVTLSLSRTCQCHCKYCAFATHQPHLHEPDEVDELLDGAERRNVKELLVLTGERPDHHPGVKAKLEELGFADFAAYVEWCASARWSTASCPTRTSASCRRDGFERLREVTASQGLMLESMRPDLVVHQGSPTKTPSVRLRGDPGRRRAEDPVHLGHPRRDRRDRGRPRRRA